MTNPATGPAQKAATRKATLLAALAAAGIARAEIDYDGEGDEGQINCITAFDANNTAVVITAAHRNVIETIAWDFLTDLHGGFQDNDGAYGTIYIDVAAATIALDHYARFTDAFHTRTEI
ncbi:DUF6878 family protein [Hyphomicrobium sp. MC8b]|uniref:DUF6878 family protein n=1 Tax=Hyphomicrobium sp. MC8b TaxID=300273 RepID=UPI00391C901C